MPLMLPFMAWLGLVVRRPSSSRVLNAVWPNARFLDGFAANAVGRTRCRRAVAGAGTPGAFQIACRWEV
jgi:hypothetical protein